VTSKLQKCDETTIQVRFRKAEQFMESADTIREFADDESDIGDAYVTLCVHAGVAAADVICCIALGEHVTHAGSVINPYSKYSRQECPCCPPANAVASIIASARHTASFTASKRRNTQSRRP